MFIRTSDDIHNPTLAPLLVRLNEHVRRIKGGWPLAVIIYYGDYFGKFGRSYAF